MRNDGRHRIELEAADRLGSDRQFRQPVERRTERLLCGSRIAGQEMPPHQNARPLLVRVTVPSAMAVFGSATMLVAGEVALTLFTPGRMQPRLDPGDIEVEADRHLGRRCLAQ